MKIQFSFDHLNSTEFEEFCKDLLHELKFINIDWKKGTGYDSSPSDDGRDIECEYIKQDVDGTTSLEKWFVDAKHYKKGIPVGSISNTIHWAEAEKPDVVLLIASNFFSNGAKRWIKSYEENNKPSFKIRLWEKPKVQELTIEKKNLLKKYGLTDLDFPFLDLVHPLHLQYIRDPPMNSLKYFFNSMEKLDNKKRDEMFSMTYNAIIMPRFRKPKHKTETIGDLMVDSVDYGTFKSKVIELSGKMFEQFLIESIIIFTLKYVFNLADSTTENERVAKMEDMIQFFEDTKSGKIDRDEYGLYEFSESETIERCNKEIASITEQIETISHRFQTWQILYKYFCDELLSDLFEENILDLLQNRESLRDFLSIDEK